MFIQEQIEYAQADDLLALPNMYVRPEATERHDVLFFSTH